MIELKFFERKTDLVAKELIGKVLVRKIDDNFIEGIIVETEAYFGLKDPASRAYNGIKNYNKVMWEEPGKIFIYNVHMYWMFNIVAHEKNEIGAVLIRAIEPIGSIVRELDNKELKKMFSGPGRLTKTLRIDKSLNGKFLGQESNIWIEDRGIDYEIGTSKRIGVRKDLKKNLRFFAKNNFFVSR
ncbi:MAG: DNA-3-methyladenine glycosylase [Candidatus Aenigmatarchaeota archaeon]